MIYDKSKMVYCKTLTLIGLSALCSGLTADIEHDEGNWSALMTYRSTPANLINQEKIKEYISEKRKALDKLEKDLELIIKRIQQ